MPFFLDGDKNVSSGRPRPCDFFFSPFYFLLLLKEYSSGTPFERDRVRRVAACRPRPGGSALCRAGWLANSGRLLRGSAGMSAHFVDVWFIFRVVCGFFRWGDQGAGWAATCPAKKIRTLSVAIKKIL